MFFYTSTGITILRHVRRTHPLRPVWSRQHRTHLYVYRTSTQRLNWSEKTQWLCALPTTAERHSQASPHRHPELSVLASRLLDMGAIPSPGQPLSDEVFPSVSLRGGWASVATRVPTAGAVYQPRQPLSNPEFTWMVLPGPASLARSCCCASKTQRHSKMSLAPVSLHKTMPRPIRPPSTSKLDETSFSCWVISHHGAWGSGVPRRATWKR